MKDLSEDELKKLNNLASLDSDASFELLNDINSIIEFMTPLKQIDTTNVAPLMHPMDFTQPLREDQAINENVSSKLGNIAVEFENNFYIVPKAENS